MQLGKKVWIILGTISCFLVLNGCINVERRIEITPIGTMKYHSETSISESAIISAGYDNLTEFYEDMVGSYKGSLKVRKIQQIQNNEMWYGFHLDGKLKKKNIEKEVSRVLGENLSFTFEKKGFFITEITANIQRLKRNKDEIKNIDQYNINDRFTIKVPYRIIDTNGLIDINNSRCSTWNISQMEFGNKKTQTMKVRYINYTNIVLCILGSVIFIALLIIIT
ncbi:MAG: hypothetical protein IKN45_03320 [Lachnospiraceae bacterium]|nr:hypothetical protein [Lachnospiraceae bacterium]